MSLRRRRGDCDREENALPANEAAVRSGCNPREGWRGGGIPGVRSHRVRVPAQLWSDATKPGGMDLESGLTSSSLAFLGIAQDRVMLSTAARYSIKRCKGWMAQGTQISYSE